MTILRCKFNAIRWFEKVLQFLPNKKQTISWNIIRLWYGVFIKYQLKIYKYINIQAMQLIRDRLIYVVAQSPK